MYAGVVRVNMGLTNEILSYISILPLIMACCLVRLQSREKEFNVFIGPFSFLWVLAEETTNLRLKTTKWDISEVTKWPKF